MATVAFPINNTMRVLETLLMTGTSSKTAEEYKKDLVALGRLIDKSLNGLIDLLLSNKETSFVTVTKLRQLMIQAGLAPNTINRRLATVRGLLRVARQLSAIDWTVEIKNLKTAKVRNTSGPGIEKIAEAITTPSNAREARDQAIILLLSTLGLRRAELCNMDLSDYCGNKIRVQRKGQLGYVMLSVPEQARNAVETWLVYRGHNNGPLFTSLDRAGKGDGRLTGRSIARITEASCGCSPHGLRHTAVTTAIELANENGVEFTECRQFSGHAKVDTLLVYRDEIRNVQGTLANAVARKIIGG